MLKAPRSANGQFRRPMPWERGGHIPPIKPATTLLSDDPRGDFINTICDQIDHAAGAEQTLPFDSPADVPAVKVGERFTLTLVGITHPVTVEKVFHTPATPTACRWRLRLLFTAAPGTPASVMLTYQQWLVLHPNQVDRDITLVNIRNGRKGRLMWGCVDGRVAVRIEQSALPFPCWEYYTVDELRALNPQ